MIIRAATESDLPGIVEIENHAIRNGVAHFGISDIAIEQTFASWKSAAGRFPWLVADKGGIIGFARADEWKSREAYRHTVTVGVYVRVDSRANGVGTALYGELFRQLADLDFHTVLAGITLPNDASVSLHEKFGMAKVAHLPEVGFKNGQWLSVGYWACVLERSNPLP